VLGPTASVSYAPPNIYPMSAPRFTADRNVDRPHPAGLDLGLYVHIPFCSYHCTFCFYATRIGADGEQKRRYVDAVLRELEWVRPGSRLIQLYVGGGTPTALPPELLSRVLEAIFRATTDHDRHAHTVETSPESLTTEHVEVLVERGIRRVSMGVQSLDDRVLDTVKRRHTRAMVEASARRLVEAGRMVNVDLIYGLPGQTHESFRSDVETVVGLGVHSFTAYNLRVNERTPVGRSLADDERLDLATLAGWRSCVADAARELGFEPQRWHTFRRRQVSGPLAATVAAFDDVTGQGDQLGVGMSARSRLSHVVFRNHPTLETYQERIESGQSPVEERFALSEGERKLRYLALTLGDGKGLSRADYRAAFGSSVESEFAEPLARLAEAELVEDQGAMICLTETGQLVYDLVTRAFYPETAQRWMQERQALAATAGNLQPRARRA
jgi:oxygen-independent coproporphyrinogen-3 oxidase